MKKLFLNDFFLNFIIYFIYFIIINFLCKKYLPSKYYENERPKLITYMIISGCISVLAYLTISLLKNYF